MEGVSLVHPLFVFISCFMFFLMENFIGDMQLGFWHISVLVWLLLYL